MDPRFPALPHIVDQHAGTDWRDRVERRELGSFVGMRMEAERVAELAASALARTHTVVALAAATALAIAVVTALAELDRALGACAAV